MGTYRFDKYKSNRDDSPNIKELVVVEFDEGKIADLEHGIAEGKIIADAVALCRDMTFVLRRPTNREYERTNYEFHELRRATRPRETRRFRRGQEVPGGTNRSQGRPCGSVFRTRANLLPFPP